MKVRKEIVRPFLRNLGRAHSKIYFLFCSFSYFPKLHSSSAFSEQCLADTHVHVILRVLMYSVNKCILRCAAFRLFFNMLNSLAVFVRTM